MNVKCVWCVACMYQFLQQIYFGFRDYKFANRLAKEKFFCL